MPFVSKKQNAWAHTAAGTEALGGPAAVKEWESHTDYSHLPERKGYAKGGTVTEVEFAKGGESRPGDTRWTKKDPQGRGDFGRFLGTKDRFTDGRKPCDYPEEAKTDEEWAKSAGHTQGDSKSLKAVAPNKAGDVSYAKK